MIGKQQFGVKFNERNWLLELAKNSNIASLPVTANAVKILIY
jgi:hypothetical protein